MRDLHFAADGQIRPVAAVLRLPPDVTDGGGLAALRRRRDIVQNLRRLRNRPNSRLPPKREIDGASRRRQLVEEVLLRFNGIILIILSRLISKII